MAPEEFKSWLDGFLDGKESLNKQEIEKIQEKSSQIMKQNWPNYFPNTGYGPLPGQFGWSPSALGGVIDLY